MVAFSVLFPLLFVLGVICVRAYLEQGEALAREESASPPLDARTARRQINQRAAMEWERRWKQETGETWGTVYTTDPEVYSRAMIEHLGGQFLDDGSGDEVIMWTIGKSGPPVVWGEDPFARKQEAHTTAYVESVQA